jgi:hypothetical protein
LFDRSEVRRVRREKQKQAASSFDQLSDPLAFVDGEVVEQDDLSRAEGRTEDALAEEREGSGIDRTIQRHGNLDAASGQRPNECRVPTMVAGDCAIGPVAFGRARIEPGEADRAAHLVHHHQIIEGP